MSTRPHNWELTVCKTI